MRLVRFRHGSRIATGSLSGEYVRPLRGTFFEEPVPTGEEIPAADVRLLAPVLPSKIVCVGRNYVEHARRWADVPEEPLLFLKPSTAVIGPGDPIPYPPLSNGSTTRPSWPWSSAAWPAGSARRRRARTSSATRAGTT